jgi:hypothetical protein
MEFMEVYSPVAVYFLVLAIIYDLFNKNILLTIIFLFDYYSLLIMINITGLYLFLKKLTITIRVNFNIDTH